MVVKIQKSHKSMSGTLRYNQQKVERGVARIVGTFNIVGMDPEEIQRTFERFERMNIMTENLSFQMSINPNPERPAEALTDAELLSYASELLSGLGYGGQPVAVYEHKDIERIHYHVVSIRTNDRGRKISDYREETKLQALMKKLQRRYHYEVGGRAEKRSPLPPLPRFDPKAGRIREQYAALFGEALKWHFCSMTQFQCVMKSMGVGVSSLQRQGPSGDENVLVFQGLDGYGRKAAAQVSQEEMGGDFFDRMRSRQRECAERRPGQEERRLLLAGKHRLEATIFRILEASKTEAHFTRMLHKAGIELLLSRNLDGEVFGATFADRRTARVFKASEISRHGLGEALKEAARPGTGKWCVNEGALREEWIARRRAEREDRRVQRNMDLAATQAVPCQEVDRTPDIYEKFEETALEILDAVLSGDSPVGKSREKDRKKKRGKKGPRKPRYS